MSNKVTRKYLPGQVVPSGVYWHGKTLELVHIPPEGGALPAGDDAVYRQLPILLLMTVGPLVGLAFVLFLPVAVPIVVLYQGWKAIHRAVARRLARVVEPEARLAR